MREVHDIISQSKSVGYTTVLKQMQVMHRKKILTRSERYRSHLYEPAQTQAVTQRQLTSSLLRQVFDGSARGLLQCALAGRKVDAREIEEIRELLDSYQRGKR